MLRFGPACLTVEILTVQIRKFFIKLKIRKMLGGGVQCTEQSSDYLCS